MIQKITKKRLLVFLFCVCCVLIGWLMVHMWGVFNGYFRVFMLKHGSEETKARILTMILNPKGNRESNISSVNDVVVCPQPFGETMLAVFFDIDLLPPLRINDRVARPFVLLDNMASPVPAFMHMNFFKGELKDINGDAIIDLVDSWAFKEPAGLEGDLFYVLPMSSSQRPTLLIAYNLRSADKGDWSWELQKTVGVDIYDIVFGPKAQNSNVITPKVVYTWSCDAQKFVGPQGGRDDCFRLLNELDKDAILLLSGTMVRPNVARVGSILLEKH